MVRHEDMQHAQMHATICRSNKHEYNTNSCSCNGYTHHDYRVVFTPVAAQSFMKVSTCQYAHLSRSQE